MFLVTLSGWDRCSSFGGRGVASFLVRLVLGVFVLVGGLVVGGCGVDSDSYSGVISVEEWRGMSVGELERRLESGELDPNQLVAEVAKDESGEYTRYKPLLAFVTNREEYALLLLRYGADPNASVQYGRDGRYSMLHHFTWFAPVEMIEKLVEYGADVDAKDSFFEDSPLLLATMMPHEFASDARLKNVIEILVENGANFNIVDNKGWNIVSRFVLYCRDEVLRYVVDMGADVNYRNEKYDGATPLAIAVASSPSYVTVLLDLGAKVDLHALNLAVLSGGVPLSIMKKLIDARGGNYEGTTDGKTFAQYVNERASGNLSLFEDAKSLRNHPMRDSSRDFCDPLNKPLDYDEWMRGGREIEVFFEGRGIAMSSVAYSLDRRHHG